MPPIHSLANALNQPSNALPRTSIFFSGNRFPLATPSSIEDHKSFLSALFGLSSLEVETCVYVDVRFAIVAFVPTSQEKELQFSQRVSREFKIQASNLQTLSYDSESHHT